MQEALHILSDLEITLMKEVLNIGGSVEVKTRIIESLGVYEKYKGVHSDYLDLYRHSSDISVKVESLKRLIFLNWYYQVEPSIYTGIGELNTEIMREAFLQLNLLIAGGSLDSEFYWMLSYYSSWDWTILNFCDENLTDLRAFVISADKFISHIPTDKSIRNVMLDRGQLGLYWQGHLD